MRHLKRVKNKILSLPQKIQLVLIIAGCCLAFGVGAFFSYRAFSASRNLGTNAPENSELIQNEQTDAIPSELPADLTRMGILILGYGGAGHDGGYLTDAIQIADINFEKATVSLISIPRDLWVKVSGKEEKINAVITSTANAQDKGQLITSGAKNLKKLLTEITGVKVDYFAGVDFVGFQRAIGINLKGIDVEVTETLDDPWYPISGEELNLCGMSPEEITAVHQKYTGFELERQFTCRYKHLHFEKGTVHMEGEQALEYVRSRHGSAEGDVSRGKRQQEVLSAIKKKLFTLEGIDKLPGFFSEIAKNTTTDIDLTVANYLLPALKQSKDYTLKQISLSTTNVLTTGTGAGGAAIMTPKEGNFKWSGIQAFIKQEMEK